MQDYFISIFYSEEDGGYIADIPDLRFCSAFGHTPEEALPKYRPAIYQVSAPLGAAAD